MNTISTEETGCIAIGTSLSIDFAIWILLQDGLHVPPFDKHLNSKNVLKSLGMAPHSWYEWVKLISISYDTRLHYYGKELDELKIEEAASARLSSVIKAATLMGIDAVKTYGSNWVKERKQEYIQEELQKYENGKKAGLQYSNIDTQLISKCEPHELYPNPDIQAQLQQLWLQYKLNHRKKHTDDCITNTNQMLSLNIKLPINDFCQIFLVDYQYEVELFVPPVFGLVSVPNKPVDYDLLRKRITNVINQNYKDF